MTQVAIDIQTLCKCGNAIKPFYRRVNLSGVGEVVVAKPVFLSECEKCTLKPVLAKRQAERVSK